MPVTEEQITNDLLHLCREYNNENQARDVVWVGHAPSLPASFILLRSNPGFERLTHYLMIEINEYPLRFKDMYQTVSMHQYVRILGEFLNEDIRRLSPVVVAMADYLITSQHKEENAGRKTAAAP
jgi:hypothetical protein